MNIYYTDYPFTDLGDEPFKTAPIRAIEVLAYDRDKYCEIKVIKNEYVTTIKSGYIYERRCRVEEADKESLVIKRRKLHMLPELTYGDDK